MSEQNESVERDETGDKRKLSVSRPGRLELRKTVDAGQVRQSFSHGRSKAVAVEVRRKRTFRQDEAGEMTEVKVKPQLIGESPAAVQALGSAVVAELDEELKAIPTLTDGERAARARALSGLKTAESDALRAAEEAAEIARQRAEEARLRRDEEDRLRADEERRQEEARNLAAAEERRAAELATRAAEGEVAKAVEPSPAVEVKPKPKEAVRDVTAEIVPEEDEEAASRGKRLGRAEPKRLAPRRGEPRRRAGRLTVTNALVEEERVRSLASLRRLREREKRAHKMPDEATKVVRDVVIPETITVQELSNRMAERAADVIKSLMKMGVMATITQAIDADTAELIVAEFGHRVRRVSEADIEIGFKGDADAEENLKPRPPVVTVMGHVDHGKTSLLDALRSTNVAAGEAGGITQHIGAYQVALASGARITFIDTPGHAAFTAMRARGANVTDIVVLVVAADDGVMPQTVEAIHHAKAAKVPIIVAINKIDKPDANVTRIRNDLLQHELVVEELGGDILAVEVSATQKKNLDRLEEAILLQSEILELGANPDRPAEGVVIESKLDHGRGAVATLLVQRGTLRVGDIVVAGGEWGRVRALVDDTGNRITAAPPSTPVEVLGLSGTPAAGDDFAVVESEGRARELTDFRQRRARDARVVAAPRTSLEQMFSRIAEGETRELAVIIKADVQGSAEAIKASLDLLSTDEVAVRVLHSGVGGINESDVTLAKASNAIIVGFDVRANPQARDLAVKDGVQIRYYSIIYQLIDDIKALLSGMLAPEIRENVLGHANVLEVFNISKIGKVAGCRVSDGIIRRSAMARLLRDSVLVHQGRLASLKRYKEDTREVREGYECGMSFENFQDVKAGDVIECYEVEQVARAL
jgi:translation initiation factor IF-2